MIIAVDFDGTIVTHEYPKIGKDIGAIPVLKELVENKHQLILYTMRSGQALDEAVKYLADAGVYIWAVNYNPNQARWTKSPKIYANMYIDDAALGIPLISELSISLRPFVNWSEVRRMLYERGLV